MATHADSSIYQNSQVLEQKLQQVKSRFGRFLSGKIVIFAVSPVTLYGFPELRKGIESKSLLPTPEEKIPPS